MRAGGRGNEKPPLPPNLFSCSTFRAENPTETLATQAQIVLTFESGGSYPEVNKHFCRLFASKFWNFSVPTSTLILW